MKTYQAFLLTAAILLSWSPVAASPTLGVTSVSSRSDDARGQYVSGVRFLFGQGVERNISAGARLVEDSARGGLPRAMVTLAALCDVGQGVPLDPARANQLRQQAARLGDPLAQQQVDDDRRYPGQTDFRSARVLTDLGMERAAIPFARRSAAQGSTNALLFLGEAYQFGAGVARDYGQAITFYQRLFEAGLPEGSRHLAYMYEWGLGVRIDRARALAYYDRAAAGGLAKARQAAAHLRSPDYYARGGGGGRGASGSYSSGGGDPGAGNSQACANRGGTMSYGSCQVYNGGEYTKVNPNTGGTEGPH